MFVLLMGVLMALAQLSIGTATDRIDMLAGTEKWYLKSWVPNAGDHAGSFADAALADYRAMRRYRDLTTIETFTLTLKDSTQDTIIEDTQDLRRMLRKAIDYWATDWQHDPVYLAAKADCETNARYAMVHDGRLPQDGNPYDQPFVGGITSIIDDTPLIIERGAWLETPPGERVCVQVSGQQELSISETTDTGRPEQSTDDAYVSQTTFNAAAVLVFGSFGAPGTTEPYQTGIRFTGMAIPQGATIVSAYVTLEASNSDGGNLCNVEIHGEDYDNAATYAGFSDFMNRTWTTATVKWPDIPDWTADTAYNTPDISSIIQEIVNRPGWASGNAIAIKFFDDKSDDSAYRRAESWDSDNPDRPILTVTYVGGTTTVGRAATCNNEVYVANKQNEAGVTHIYWNSGAAWSGNLIGAAMPFDLFDDPIATGDVVYFGNYTLITDHGPFCSLVFDIERAATYTPDGAGNYPTITWQYRTTGGAWAALAVQDNTAGLGGFGPGPFALTGVNSVHWEQPSDWDDNYTVNGVDAYWVRALVTIGAGQAISTPRQQNRDIYSVLWGSILVDDAQVPGDIPALLEYQLHNQSANAGTITLADEKSDQIICGLRTTERGENFSAFINLSNQQNQAGIGVFSASARTTFVVDSRAITGTWARYRPGGVLAFTSELQINFGQAIFYEYVGAFHAYLRCRHTEGGNNGSFGARLMSYNSSYPARTYSDVAYTQRQDIIELLDLGRISLPAMQTRGNELLNGWNLYVELSCLDNTSSPDLIMYDLVLIPIDEWAAEIVQIIEEGIAQGLIRPLDALNYLDFDGVRNPKAIESFVRDGITNYAKIPYTVHPNRWPSLLANKEQRLWFVTACPNYVTFLVDKRQSTPYTAHSLQAWRNARYLSMRGSR